jgi:hypothetical protein
MIVARNRILLNYTLHYGRTTETVTAFSTCTLHKSLSLHTIRPILRAPFSTKGTSNRKNKKNSKSKLSYKQRNKSPTMMSDIDDGTDPNKAEAEVTVEATSDTAANVPATGTAVVSNQDEEKRKEELDQELNAVGYVTSIVLQHKRTNETWRSCALFTLFDSYW